MPACYTHAGILYIIDTKYKKEKTKGGIGMENLKQIADEQNSPLNRPIVDEKSLYEVAEAYKRTRSESVDTAVTLHGLVLPFLARVARAGGRKCRIDPWTLTAGESDALHVTVDNRTGKIVGTPELRIESVMPEDKSKALAATYSLRWLLFNTKGIARVDAFGAFGRPCIDVEW